MALETMVLPRCGFDGSNVGLIVDDVLAITTENQLPELNKFDESYQDTMQMIGFKLKPPSNSPFKAYRARTEAEVLGCVISTPDLTWTLSTAKIVDFLVTVDECISPLNILNPVVLKLKIAQKCLGKIVSISTFYRKFRRYAWSLNLDVIKAIKAFPLQNEVHEDKQIKIVVLSTQTRVDLTRARAFIASLEQVRCKIQDPNREPSISCQVVAFTDASGKMFEENGDPAIHPPALGVYIPTQLNQDSFAGAFTLPKKFMEASDNRSKNRHNSTLLELLAVLSAVTYLAEEWRGKAVHIVTDSAALVAIYASGLPSGDYTAFALNALVAACQTWEIALDLKWEPRRARQQSVIADDLTHQDFQNVPPHVTRRVVERVPAPILETLLESSAYCAHTFAGLYPRMEQFWRSKIRTREEETRVNKSSHTSL